MYTKTRLRSMRLASTLAKTLRSAIKAGSSRISYRYTAYPVLYLQLLFL